MKRTTLVLALAVAAALARADYLPDRKPIDVDVVGGQVRVGEGEAVTVAGEGALVWRLEAGYAFADDGIVIDSPGLHHCIVTASGEKFRCVKLKHVPGAKYKYTVNVIDRATQKPLAPLDPWILNN